jgi:LemA protein
MDMITLILLTAAVFATFFFIAQYNKIIRSKNQIENSISSLDALYIKRSDLIPNLVAIVRQYMKFEESTLEKVTSMRTSTSATNPSIENDGSSLLKGMMVQLENYPELKANTQFTNLQFSWNESEEQISAGRRYVSASVTEYNNRITMFPSNLIASLFALKTYEWKYAKKEQQENINANELFTN